MGPERDNPDQRLVQAESVQTQGIQEARLLPAGVEAVEKVPELQLTVERTCNTPRGRYVGLSQWHREQLKVAVGETVELFDRETSLGVFTVGAGSKDLLGRPQVFTANEVPVGAALTVRPRKTPIASEMQFQVQHMAEKVNAENHERRQDIIEHRLKLDPDVYITIPTALAAQLGIKPPAGKTIAPISMGRIRDADGQERQIAIVPTGSNIGFTSKAARELNIPSELDILRLRIDNGVLVIA